MKGKVIAVKGDKCIYLTDSGYGYFCDSDFDDLSIGDIIVGSLDEHGESRICKQGGSEYFCAYIDAIQMPSLEYALLLLE